MPVSVRHQRAAKRQAKPVLPTSQYRIVDPNHKPDLHGQLGGGKVFRQGEHQLVHLTDKQAQYYRDQGVLVHHKVDEVAEDA